jgi:SAM-dependent methyltransferase
MSTGLPPPGRDTIEGETRRFYEEQGWKVGEDGVTLDAHLWEDLRQVARWYVSACRRRVGAHIGTGDRLLDAGSGPIQYAEYVEYSGSYRRRTCVDLSVEALQAARRRIGAHGEYACGSLTALPFSDDQFDGVTSLHVVYHVDALAQEHAVRELIRVARPNAAIVIVYGNPDRLVARIKRLINARRRTGVPRDPLYYHAHEIGWWSRFADACCVSIHPWRTLTATDMRRLIPNNALGSFALRCLFAFESLLPAAAVRIGASPMIVLRKRALPRHPDSAPTR